MNDVVVKGKNSANSLISRNVGIIALGSNMNFECAEPLDVVEGALAALEVRGFVIRARSRYFNTPAFPAGSGPDFVNAVAVFEAPFDAAGALVQMHEVEAGFGRARALRWGARTLDLDLIAMGDSVFPDAQMHQYWRDLPLEAQKTQTPQELVLPHPRLAERAFVLVPLLDVAPDWRHPVTGASVRQMHDALSEVSRKEVVALQ